MTLASALLIGLLQQPVPVDAHLIVAQATTAVERDSVAFSEERWRRILATRPRDRSALLGMATLARLTARPERADSFATRIIDDSAAPPDAFSVLARIGRAQTLANGRATARADSELVSARGDARAIGSPRLEANAMLVLANVRSRSMGTRAALALITESRQLYPSGTPQEEALRLCLAGSFAARLGQAAAARALDSGVDAAREAREWRTYAHCRLLRAQISEERGYFDEAFINLDTAVHWMRVTRSDAALAVALQWGAFVRYQTRDLARARRDYLEAVRLAVRARDAAVEAWSYTGLAQIALSISDLSGSRAYLARARALHLARNDRWGYATVRELEGDLDDALGDVSSAREALTEAVDVQTAIGQPLLAVAPLRRLARLELEAGHLDAAAAALRTAQRFATASRNQGFLNELPFHEAGIAIARGQLDAADSLLRSMTQMETGESQSRDLAYNFWIRRSDLAMRRQDFDASERAMSRALTLLAQWRDVQSEKDLRLRAAQARRPWGTFGEEAPALIARLSASGRVSSAFALAEATRARELLRSALQRTALDADSGQAALVATRLRTQRDVATLEQVQQSLDDSTAMLAYVAGLGGAPTTVFIVSRQHADVRTLAPIDSIARVLDRYVRLTAAGAAPSALARTLSDAVFTPAVAVLPAGVTHLVIVPELSLYRVPFDALPLSDGRFAAEQFSVSIAPSATLAITSQRDREVATPGALLAFGDVVSASEPGAVRSVRGSVLDDATPLPTLPRLPYSGDEVRRIARYAPGARVLVRAAASADALRSADLHGVGIMHFATHALVDDASLQRNLLALSATPGNDGVMGPDALSALRIDRSLVVLSGCRTVAGIVLGGEGLRGLTAPLLEAGARAVIATQWAIGDQSTLPFIDRLYSHLASGLTVGNALQQAKRDAIRDHVRPSVWAAFVLVGDGTMHIPLSPLHGPRLPWGKVLTTP